MANFLDLILQGNRKKDEQDLEKFRYAQQRADEDRRKRDLAKWVYLGAPDQRTAEQRMIDIETSAPLATSATNILTGERAKEGLLGVADEGKAYREAAKFGAEQSRRGRERLLYGPTPQALGEAESEALSSAVSGNRLNKAIHDTQFETLPTRRATEDIAGTSAANLGFKQTQAAIPQVPMQAEDVAGQAELARLAREKEKLRLNAITPEDILQQAATSRLTLEEQQAFLKLKMAHPELFTPAQPHMMPVTGQYAPIPGIPGFTREYSGPPPNYPPPLPGAPTSALTPGGNTLQVGPEIFRKRNW